VAKDNAAQLIGQDLKFVENKGQWDPSAKFMAQMKGLNLWVTNTGLVYDWVSAPRGPTDKADHNPIFVDFVGASGQGIAKGEDAQPGVMNFYQGKSKATNVKGYREATIKDLYPGIDLVTYFDKFEKGPRYDLVVHPGADPNQVHMRYRNAKNLHVDKDGALIYDVKGTEVAERRQMAYQKGDKGVDFHFFPQQQINKDGTVSFDTTGYRKDRTLVIDPLIWSNLIEGDGTTNSGVTNVATDASGNLYVAGFGATTFFTSGFGPTGRVEAYIAKFEPNGTLDWYDRIGGSSYQNPTSLIVDKLGFPCAAITTLSTDFYTTIAAPSSHTAICRFDPSNGGVTYSEYLPNAGFQVAYEGAMPSGEIVVLTSTDNSQLSLSKYSTTGAFEANTTTDAFDFLSFCPPVVDSTGQIFIAASTTADFGGAHRSSEDAALGSYQEVIIGFDSALVGHTGVSYIGAVGRQDTSGICIDGSDNVIVTANIRSNDNGHLSAPSVNGWQSTTRTVPCGYVVKLSNDLTTILASTSFASPSFDFVYLGAPSLDSSGNVLVTESGYTNLPLTWDYFSGHATDSGLVKFSPNLSSIVYATYLFDSYFTNAYTIAQDPSNNIYVGGGTTDPNFTIVPGGTPVIIPPGHHGRQNISYISVLNPTATSGLTRITSDRGAAPALAGGVGKSVTVNVYFTEDPGTSISLSSPNPKVYVNGGISAFHTTLGAERVATFTVTADDMTTATPVVLTASDGTASLPITVTVQPFMRLLVTKPTAAVSGQTLTTYVYTFEQPATSQVVTFSGDVPGAVLPGQTCTIVGLDTAKTSGATLTTVNLGNVNSPTTVNLTATAATGSWASAAFTMSNVHIKSITFSSPTIGINTVQGITMTLTGPALVDMQIPLSCTNPQFFAGAAISFNHGDTVGSTSFTTPGYLNADGAKTVQISATLNGVKTGGSYSFLTSGYDFGTAQTDIAEGNPLLLTFASHQPVTGTYQYRVTSTSPANIPSVAFGQVGLNLGSGSQSTSTNIIGITKPVQVRLASEFVVNGSVVGPAHFTTVTVHPELTSITLASPSVHGGRRTFGFFNLYAPCESFLGASVSSNNPLVSFDTDGGTTGSFVFFSEGPVVPFQIFTKPVTKPTNVIITFTNPLGYKTRSLSLTLTP